jgi:uncharacterized protein YutE (UPF0331/DUF86 family)
MTNLQLKEYCDAEFENINKVVSEVASIMQLKEEGFTIVELAAMATFLHNFYNGIENILKRTLLSKEIEIPDTPTWHKDLLKTSSDLGIITPDLYQQLSNYLSFRHFFIHTYSFTLNWEHMKPLVESIDVILKRFKQKIYDYIG